MHRLHCQVQKIIGKYDETYQQHILSPEFHSCLLSLGNTETSFVFSRLLAALLLATFFVACSGQKEQLEKGGFNIVGAWQLVQEEWINGDVITEGFEHYKICYDDQTFLDLRCHPEDDDDDFFCAVSSSPFP